MLLGIGKYLWMLQKERLSLESLKFFISSSIFPQYHYKLNILDFQLNKKIATRWVILVAISNFSYFYEQFFEENAFLMMLLSFFIFSLFEVGQSKQINNIMESNIIAQKQYIHILFVLITLNKMARLILFRIFIIQNIPKMWSLFFVRQIKIAKTIIIALLIFQLIPIICQSCETDLQLKRSKQQCSFRYVSKDEGCSKYQFKFCSYYYNQTKYWLWIFTDQIISHYVQSSNSTQCSEICCKKIIQLPNNFTGYSVCQEELLKHSVMKIGIVGKFIQLIVASIFFLILAGIIIGIWNSIGDFADGLLNRNRRDIQMQLIH